MKGDSRAHGHILGIKQDSNMKAKVSLILDGPASFPRAMVACQSNIYYGVKQGLIIEHLWVLSN